MNNKMKKSPLTPEEIRQKAKKIISNNPTYINDEPQTVGSPDNLLEELKEDNDEADRKSN